MYIRALARLWLPPRDIADLAVYHRGPRARACGPGFYLALLLLPLRRYAGRCCCCCDTAERDSHARQRETQRPNPQRIVHTVLIGIHCRDSDLCRGDSQQSDPICSDISGSSRACRVLLRHSPPRRFRGIRSMHAPSFRACSALCEIKCHNCDL